MNDLRYLNIILTVLVVLLALNLTMYWGGESTFTSTAQAQGIPDEGAQRKQIIDELKRLNSKADQLRNVLVSGQVFVRTSE